VDPGQLWNSLTSFPGRVSYEATELGLVLCFTVRLFAFFCVILSCLFSYTFDYFFSVLMLLVGSFDL